MERAQTIEEHNTLKIGAEVVSDRMPIIDWLEKNSITKYIINSDLSVDVNGSVNLRGKNLNEIPIQFGTIMGDFSCADNNLTSLKGCPTTVLASFSCVKNNLISLEYSPQFVGGDFLCSLNNLITLLGSPEKVNRNFDCSYNELISLGDGPLFIDGGYWCNNNKLIFPDSFKTPKRIIVAGTFYYKKGNVIKEEGTEGNIKAKLYERYDVNGNSESSKVK